MVSELLAFEPLESEPCRNAPIPTPWQGVFPVNLQWLLDLFQKEESSPARLLEAIETERHQRIGRLKEALARANQPLSGEAPRPALEEDAIKAMTSKQAALEKLSHDAGEREALKSRVERLVRALARFQGLHMPVIEVPTEFIDGDGEHDQQDPPLAILFQRIGTGGTALTNADYVYSVLKHRNPNCHQLVEQMLGDPQVAALFTPVALVGSAVRLTAAGLGLNDHPQIDKTQFARLLKAPENTAPENESAENSPPSFLDTFNRNIEEGGLFRTSLTKLLDALRYTGERDIGFPTHALCLIELPILEALLYWLIGKHGDQVTSANQIDTRLSANRDELIRFALYCALAVPEITKASSVLFKTLKDIHHTDDFPDHALVAELLRQDLALPMRSPKYLKSKIASVVESPEYVQGLRDWRRFSLPDIVGEKVQLSELERRSYEKSIELYQRFWNRRQRGAYQHELLLWLQRNYVEQQFAQTSVLPGSEDDTPYDYDHLCPKSHWHDWRGITSKDRIIDFLHPRDTQESQPQSWIGNSIGNLRVWASSDNRSLGDVSPQQRLPLDKPNEDIENILRYSVIGDDEHTHWKDCSNQEGTPPSVWDEKRVLAFQRAVELRTFNLYKNFYTDLRFDESWPTEPTPNVT